MVVICRVVASNANEAASGPSIEWVTVSPSSASVAAGTGSPTSVPAAVFSAMLRVSVASANTGPLLSVLGPPLTAILSAWLYLSRKFGLPQDPEILSRNSFAMDAPASVVESSPASEVSSSEPFPKLPDGVRTRKYRLSCASVLPSGMLTVLTPLKFRSEPGTVTL